MSIKKILVVSHDKVGPSMAGPGIRYHQIANELSKHFDTTLGVFNPAYIEGLEETSYKVIDIKTYDFKTEFQKFDAIFALWLSNEMIEYAKSINIKLIFDLYAPVPVEDYIGRKYSLKHSVSDDKEYLSLVNNYRFFLSVGDFFVCSNEIQKDFWTGFAFATDSIAPGKTEGFNIEDRISLLPMGVNLEELKNTSKNLPLKKEFPEIKSDDFVLVWTGGIWDWFDGTTPVKAIQELTEKGFKNVKLVFLGTKHPNPDIPEMGETLRTLELSKKLGLYGKSVFFREGWIDYDKRLDYLREADVALYAHRSELEARYSHRTRVLDHILIGLPTIATKGDFLTELIDSKGYGVAVKPQDVKELSKTIEKLMRKDVLSKYKSNLDNDRHLFTWEESVKPLVSFLKSSDMAPRPFTEPSNRVVAEAKSNFTLKIKKYMPNRVKTVIRRFM